jgi:hypothetical protein
MTKKHFIAMAAEFKTLWKEADENVSLMEMHGIEASIQAFIRVAKQDNPRFNAARFRVACGLED